MMEWQVAEKDHQTYGFFYDANDRLIEAEYGERTSSAGSYSLNHRYQTEYSYFENGDLHTLSRKGRIADGTYVTIDDLTYNYYADQTRLQDVDDDASDTDNIRDYGFAYYDITATGADYTYDANGNITYDPAKGLTISYNHLNLPVEVTKAGGGSIAWLYDANGNKLRKTSQPDALSLSGTIPTGVYQADQITSDGTVPTGAAVLFRAGTEIELQAGFETQINSDFEATIAINGSGVQDYVGGMEYRDGALEAIYHECGRLFFGGTSAPRYEYTIADHLGNTRVTFADLNGDGQVDASEVLQENQYYPFGMQMEGDWLQHSEERNAYQYNGKEFNQDLGLNWLDYGARWYDPTIARWNAVDPLAEEYQSWSPFNYTMNSPINFIDPDGQQVTPTISKNDDGQNVVTINVTGSIIDLSSNLFANPERLARRLKRLGKSLSGDMTDLSGLGLTDADGNEITEAIVNFSFDFSAVDKISEIGKDDHLVVLADFGANAPGEGQISNGVTSTYGGRLMYVDADATTGPMDIISGYGTVVTGHEIVAHALNTGHAGNNSKITYGGGVWSFSRGTLESSRKKIVENATTGQLNRGPILMDWLRTGLVPYRDATANGSRIPVSRVGVRWDKVVEKARLRQ